MFRNPRIAEKLNHHKTLSPLSLGFDLQSAATTANVFQERLLDGDRFGTGAFQHYPILREIQPDWAPFISRLAYHAYDIFVVKHIRLLREMATNLVATAKYLLPGIDKHPYLPSFTLKAMRWFVCNCETLNCVGNCGHPTRESICVNCRVALSQAYPNPRPGVRRATARDLEAHWAYARRVFADRQTLQLELARNGQLRKTLPFLSFLLDDENWMRKLNALQYLGDALRFVALVRTVLAGEITVEEANRMTIAQGLEKITDIVMQKVILLDRGRPVATREHVMDLFDGFKQLWDRFSQLENAEKKTFLDYFECQQVDVNVRPKTILDQAAPLILILAGSELPETTFSCQLLSHAVEAASSIALTDFIQPHCRVGSGRVRLSCSSAAAFTDFDESLYAHVSTEEVDNFIRDHVIDRSTLQLAESFAMAAILGPAGSTIAEELSLDVIPEFVFKDDVESGNFLVSLERRSIPWQPSTIPPQLQELILADLEKNRCLAEARSVLISVVTHLQSNTEPLVVSKVRKNYICDVLEELVQAEVMTERHVSNATVGALNRHLKLEGRHAFGLLKAIVARIKGDDIFGGRVRDGWTTMIPERLAQLTSQKLRADAQPGGILESVLQIVNVVSGTQPVPVELTPDKSLMYAIRQIEGPEWDGIPAELKMEHLGHLLLIVESVAKK